MLRHQFHFNSSQTIKKTTFAFQHVYNILTAVCLPFQSSAPSILYTFFAVRCLLFAPSFAAPCSQTRDNDVLQNQANYNGIEIIVYQFVVCNVSACSMQDFDYNPVDLVSQNGESFNTSFWILLVSRFKIECVLAFGFLRNSIKRTQFNCCASIAINSVQNIKFSVWLTLSSTVLRSSIKSKYVADISLTIQLFVSHLNI